MLSSHEFAVGFLPSDGSGIPAGRGDFFSPQSDSAQRNLVKRVAAAVGLVEQNWKTLEKLLKRLEKAVTRQKSRHPYDLRHYRFRSGGGNLRP